MPPSRGVTRASAAFHPGTWLRTRSICESIIPFQGYYPSRGAGYALGSSGQSPTPPRAVQAPPPTTSPLPPLLYNEITRCMSLRQADTLSIILLPDIYAKISLAAEGGS